MIPGNLGPDFEDVLQLSRILLAVTLAAICIALAVAIGDCEAHADDGPSPAAVAAAIRTLQPATAEPRANRLATVFHTAAHDHGHDALLLVAIAFRESSLSKAVELRRRRGALGELGLMQSHGAALRVRPADCNHHLVGARCQVQTGAAWLSYARMQCGGSWWRWVAAYGLRACPSERMAREDGPARVAHRHYLRIGGTRWR